MIHTKGLELELLVVLLETLLFELLREWCAFCGNNSGGLCIEALWFGESRTVTATAEGNRSIRVDINIKR